MLICTNNKYEYKNNSVCCAPVNQEKTATITNANTTLYKCTYICMYVCIQICMVESLRSNSKLLGSAALPLLYYCDVITVEDFCIRKSWALISHPYVLHILNVFNKYICICMNVCVHVRRASVCVLLRLNMYVCSQAAAAKQRIQQRYVCRELAPPEGGKRHSARINRQNHQRIAVDVLNLYRIDRHSV